METLVTIVHVIVALFMILVVLVQGGNQGGIGAAFGGGNSQGVFGASGATSFLGKLTYAAAMIFMVTSVSLAIMQGKGGDVGMSEKLKALNEEKTQEKAEPQTEGQAPVEKKQTEPQEKPADAPESNEASKAVEPASEMKAEESKPAAAEPGAASDQEKK